MHNWKRIAAAFLVVVQLFLLCGCTALDEMRQNHAFVQDKDIVWNGATYRLLPACDTLCPDADYETSIYATAPDVPVLLSFFYADNVLSPSQDGRFLISFFEDMIYCREDQYEQIKQRIRDGFADSIEGITDGAVDFVVWIIASSPYLVVYGTLLTLAVIILRRIRRGKPIFRKKGTHKSDPPAENR